MSLGHPVFESYRVDPLGLAVENAVKAGYVVVTSAGNMGKTQDGRKIIGGIGSPCNTPASLCVGASNTKGTAYRSDDEVASYSSTGPTPFDGLLKPEIVAPGNKIVAAAALQSKIVQDYPERIVSGGGQNSYIELSGTSWAAAMVSGAAALLRQAQPSLTPADVKLALQITSSPVAGAGLIEAGAGALKCSGGRSIGHGAPPTPLCDRWGATIPRRHVLQCN